MEVLSPPNFMPHGHCFLWNPGLLILHVGSDLLIALAYFSIPFALVYFARKRPDLEFRFVLVMFAVFILACGLTHVGSAWNVWVADYWVTGVVKAVAAISSVATAVWLWKLMPAAISLPSPAQLQAANDKLLQEVQHSRAMHEALRESEAQLRGAFDHAPIGKCLAALSGQWFKVNAALCDIVGHSPQELLAMERQNLVHPADRPTEEQLIAELVAGRRSRAEAELRYIHRDGYTLWIFLSITRVPGKVDCLILHMQDITARRQAEVELRHAQAELEARVVDRTQKLADVNQRLAESNLRLEQLTRTDVLSSLHNRHHLTEVAQHALHAARRHNIKLSLMMMDIDEFKTINDRYGHRLGDRVIAEVGKVIKSSLRDTDVAARIGGDEFCVLATYADIDEATHIAEKLRHAIGQIRIDDEQGHAISLTCSIGVVSWHYGIDQIDHLLELADQALYEAKSQGRNCVARAS